MLGPTKKNMRTAGRLDNLGNGEIGMTWRCKGSFVFATVVVDWLASCPLAIWPAEPPEISHVRVDMPFERAYPGEPVLLRTHQSPHTRWQMQVADEMGVC